MDKEHACGMCGHKTDGNGNRIEMGEDFDPNKCILEYCYPCAMGYEQEQTYRTRQVTREMAMGAQDPSLEGQTI